MNLNGVSIPLFWWIRPAPGNMGDWLSPYIIHKLTGFPVKYENTNDSKLISLGSIGKFIKDHHVVWGTGISSYDTPLNINAKYLAVRGPYTTAEALKIQEESRLQYLEIQVLYLITFTNLRK